MRSPQSEFKNSVAKKIYISLGGLFLTLIVAGIIAFVIWGQQNKSESTPKITNEVVKKEDVKITTYDKKVQLTSSFADRIGNKGFYFYENGSRKLITDYEDWGLTKAQIISQLNTIYPELLISNESTIKVMQTKYDFDFKKVVGKVAIKHENKIIEIPIEVDGFKKPKVALENNDVVLESEFENYFIPSSFKWPIINIPALGSDPDDESSDFGNWAFRGATFQGQILIDRHMGKYPIVNAYFLKGLILYESVRWYKWDQPFLSIHFPENYSWFGPYGINHGPKAKPKMNQRWELRAT